MVLELAEEGSLEDLIEKHRQANSQIDERTIWKLIAQMLLGLHELKCHEMVHCDLKPSNILLRKNLQLYLSDLNACKKSGSQFKLDTQVTPYYAR
jgi:serine/threonine protein kinase